MNTLFGVPLDAVYHLVAGFTGFLTPVLGGLAAIAAIIAFTIAIRIILMPLSFRAMRGQAVQARLAPQLQELQKRYAKQPERLQREMAALYKREGTSMFAGLAPILLQWPLLSVIYLLFRSAQVGGKPNMLLTHHLLGVPLGAYWLGGAGPVSAQGLVFVGVFALLAGLCWLSVRLSQRMTAQAAAAPARGAALVPAARSGQARRAPAKATSAKAAAAKATSAQTASAQTASAQTTSAQTASAQTTSAKAAAAKATSAQTTSAQTTSAQTTSAKAAAAKATSAQTASAQTTSAKAAPVPGGALLKVLPYLTVVIAAFAPLAAGIYLIVSTGWSLAERRYYWRSGRVSGADPAEPGTPVVARPRPKLTS